MNNDPNVQVTTTMRHSQHQRLITLSRDTQESMAAMIRRAIDALLAKESGDYPRPDADGAL